MMLSPATTSGDGLWEGIDNAAGSEQSQNSCRELHIGQALNESKL